MVAIPGNPLAPIRTRAIQLMRVPVEDLTQEEVKLIAHYAHHDPIFFCKYFLAEFFPGRVPWLHYGVMAILTKKCQYLQDYTHLDKIMKNFIYERDGVMHPIFYWEGDELKMDLQRFTLLMLPRGFSKTTYAGIAFPLHNILYQTLSFACYVSETATHAQTQLDNIKTQLETNEKIKFFFGELRPGMQDPQRWRQDEFETTTGMAMVARGRGGQVRGLNKNGKRPKLIIMDDVEDKESVATDDQRKKSRAWAYADVMPALPALDSEAAIVALATPLHVEALAMVFCRDPQWNVVKIEAFDSDGELVWPENLDEVKLRARLLSATVAGTLGEYFMEYRLQIKTDLNRSFEAEMFQYGSPRNDEPIIKSLYVDPAISPDRRADHCTFTVAAIVAPRGKNFVLHSSGGIGIKPADQVDKIFELWSQYQPDYVGIEANAYQAALVHLVREEQFRRQKYFEVIPVTNQKKKALRISGILQPRYAKKHVFHAGQFKDLEKQLLEFPEGAKDDYADGAAGAFSLLDPAASYAEDTPIEEPPLEDVIGGNWRHAV